MSLPLYFSPPPEPDDLGPLPPPRLSLVDGDAHPDETPEHPDRALVERIRSGDPLALKALVDQYATPLIHFAAQLAGSYDMAEDIMQDVLFRVWERRETWQPYVGVRAYLFGAVRNAVYKTHRHEQVVAREHAQLALEVPHIVEPVEPDDTGLMRRQFRIAFGSLTTQQRAVLRLRYEQLLSAREIAVVFGVSTRAVERMLGRAISTLREAIEA